MSFAFPRYKSSQVIVWCIMLISVWSMSACQPIQPVQPVATEAQQIPEVLIEVNDTEFTIPADFPGGIVAVTVQNNSDTELDVSFARLREGTSMAEIQELAEDFMSNLIPILEKTGVMASFNPVPAGESREIIIDFKTGEFLLDATEHTEEDPLPGAAHIYGSFTADEIVGTVEPQADVTVEMRDFTFIMPDEIKAGELLWQFNNQGEQWHMALMLKPTPGVSMEVMIEAMLQEGEPSGPPPFEFVADVGVPPISEGERAWLSFELEPGEYLVICPIPDVAAMAAGEEPMAHVEKGMHRVLTVK